MSDTFSDTFSDAFPDRDAISWLIENATERGNQPALSVGTTQLTHAQFLERIQRRAGLLHARGVRPGQRVALYMDDDLELMTTLLAGWGVGATCLPLPITQPAEAIRRIEGIVPPDVGFTVAGAAPEHPRDFEVHGIDDEPGAPRELRRPDPNDHATVSFTSGTSGVPKAVPMTHRALGHNAFETGERLRLAPDDRILINSPPFYTSPIIHWLTLLSHGGSVAVERGLLFGPSLLEFLAHHGCTGFGGVPVHFLRLAAALEEGCAAPPDLRFLMNSGEHLPRPVLASIRAQLPHVRFYSVYGLTEVAGRLCILDADRADDKGGSVGQPLPGMTISIRDDNGTELPPAELGQVYVRGRCLMEGYLNNPEANARLMTPHGFATGDIGTIDDDGDLFLRGRADDVLKVGGEKVSMNLIEEAIYGYADFADFVVSPVADERMGLVPCLYYVLAEGARFRRKDLIRRLRASLPANHIPTRYVALDEIPRATSGKVDRKSLPT